MNALITIDTFTIKQDTQGRYCLNDLHKASGGADTHAPAKFFRNQTTQDLINEISQSTNLSFDPVQSIRGGSAPGTFVVKELVYAYAMWISASFQAEQAKTIAAQNVELQAVKMPEDTPHRIPRKAHTSADASSSLKRASRLINTHKSEITASTVVVEISIFTGIPFPVSILGFSGLPPVTHSGKSFPVQDAAPKCLRNEEYPLSDIVYNQLI